MIRFFRWLEALNEYLMLAANPYAILSGINHQDLTASRPPSAALQHQPTGARLKLATGDRENMNKQYYLKNGANYFVLGAGFSTSNQANASKLTQAQIDCAKGLGYTGTSIPVVVSFAVNYIRATDLDAAGNVQPNKRNPSKRRFATKDEAVQHGKRFEARRLKQGDAAGTAGHIGFYVTESTDAVNAKINWKTGLTNSL